MKPERRKNIRYDVPLNVEFIETERGSRFYSGVTLNFSSTGMCIMTADATPELSGAVELKVTLPEKDIAAPAVGDIVWTGRAENRYLLGIQFVAIDKEARSGILAYCRNLREEKPN